MLNACDLIAFLYVYVLVDARCHHSIIYVEKPMLVTLISLFIRVRTTLAIVVIELVFVKPDSSDFKQQTTIHEVAQRVEAT